MAYTPPLGNAVNFNDLNGAYTPPAGNAVNFDTTGGGYNVALAGLQAGMQGGLLGTSITGSTYTTSLVGQQLLTLQGGEVPGYGASLVGRQATVGRGTTVGIIPPEVNVALTGRQVTATKGVLGGVVAVSVNITLEGRYLYVNHVLGRLSGQSGVMYAYYGWIQPPITYYEYMEGQGGQVQQGTFTPVISRFVTLRGHELKARSFNFIVSTDKDVQVPLSAFELLVQQAKQEIDWLSHFHPVEWVVADSMGGTPPTPPMSLTTSGDADPNNNFTVATDTHTGDNWTNMPPIVLSNGDALVWGGKRYFELGVQLPPEGAKPFPIPPPPRPPYNSYYDPTSYEVGIEVALTFRSNTYVDWVPSDPYLNTMLSSVYIDLKRGWGIPDGSPFAREFAPGVRIIDATGNYLPPRWIDYVDGKRIMIAVDLDRDTDWALWGKIWVGYDGKWFDFIDWGSNAGGDPELGAPPISAVFQDPVLAEPLIIGLLSYRSSNDSQYPPPPVIPITTPTQVRLYARRDNQLFRPKDFYPWEEAGPRDDGLRLTGRSMVIDRGFYVGLGPPPIDSLQATVLQGTFGLTAGVKLTGLAATTGRGTIVGSRDIIMPLVGQATTCQSGALSPSKGLTLVGQVLLVVDAGAFAIERGVTPAGQELTVLRGMFPGLGVEVPQTGEAATVERGAFAVDTTVQLVGQSLAATIAAFVPAFNLRPVGLELRVDRGTAVPLLHPFLSGLSLVATSGGTLQISLTATPTGLQATVEIGQPGYLYDCNLFLTGVHATGMVGTEPTQTNVPPISDKLHLWAKREVEKLFNKVEPTR